MRNIQHKKEAYWFYRFLSIFYDRFVNPFFWTPEMREQSLQLARLESAELLTLDAGSGTGFTTQGIVKSISPVNVTCIDQSPHQMKRAKKKPELNGCNFLLGDAENLPFPNDHFDRYVSAGSIEYWPNPQQGIAEAYRILKQGGIAVIIGPLRPKNWLARTFADIWMLFPEEEDYLRWFREAGFVDLQKKWIAPDWVLKERYAIALSGVKAGNGLPLLKSTSPALEKENERFTTARFILFIQRLLIGSFAGFVFIPMAIIGTLRFHVLRLFSSRKSLSGQPK